MMAYHDKDIEDTFFKIPNWESGKDQERGFVERQPAGA